MSVQDSVGFQVYWECAFADKEVMRNWIISRTKAACERSQRGPLIVVVLDEDGHEIGRNEIGAVSAALKAMAREDEDNVDHAARR